MVEEIFLDNFLNGEEAELPSSLTISKFSAARIREIEILEKALSSSSAVKLAFQKLPKHMRRRTMSHNVKRLPRRLREIHSNQMKKSGLPPKQKRPSRKYRRRPANLTSDFIRRKRGITWLNTHIWHAKRFHMIKKWGFKLPLSPCEKSFRACYRATKKHCLLQDISYYSCIEVCGSLNEIVNGLNKITKPYTGLSVAAKPYISGLREGKITLFHINSEKAIGIVDFQWRPCQNTSGKCQLWLWIHAAYYDESLKTLINCFNLQQRNDNSNYSSQSMELNELKWELNKFRLTGPLSTAVLQSALKLANADAKNPGWFFQFLNETAPKMIHSPNDKWGSLKNSMSPSEISPHILLPLVIEDPRYNFPKKRTKALSCCDSSKQDIEENVEYDSPLWSSNIRNLVEQSKISSVQLDKLRSNLLVPGSALDEPGAPVPIILVHRPGRKGKEFIGYGSGWDIILPSVWAQPLWLSLIMWGARTGGLREANSIDFESSYQYLLYPDTAAGNKEEIERSKECTEIFFKLPPNKRTNYKKFCISSPFQWNWKMLLNEWSVGSYDTDFFVLRDKVKLRVLQKNLANKLKTFENPDICENCLIPVTINLSNRGKCTQFAVICFPQEGDMKNEPIEAEEEDPNEKLRKELRSKHKALLKTLRKRRVRAKNKGKIIPIDEDALRDYSTKMKNLWVPETTGLRHSCSREVLGIVKHGDFSFLTGKSKAIGYITINALFKLMTSKYKDKVLVRNTNSRQYRIGTLDIICD